MKKNNQVTIKDVAREAGASIATVSRAINNNYPVSDDLRSKINAAIEKLNYHPNALASSLRSNHTKTLAYLVTDLADPVFTSILKGVEDVVSPLDFSIISASTDSKSEKELSYLKLFLEKQVDGILLNTSGFNNEFIVEISAMLPTVLIHRQIEQPGFIGDFVGSDDFAGIFELTKLLLENNHKKIGLINGDIKITTGRDRYRGYIQALHNSNIINPDDSRWIYNGGYSIHHGLLGAKQILENSEWPSAIIATNNELAIGALTYFRKKGIRIPDDLSFVSYGDIPTRDVLYINPTISLYSEYNIGYKAAELLLDRINQQPQPMNNREIRLSSNIVQGDSVSFLNL